MMSETNNSQSPSRALELDFGTLPDLPNLNTHGTSADNFNLEDFFSTDAPMPSSPPVGMFQLYEDPMGLQIIDWSELGNYGQEENGEGNGGEGDDEVMLIKSEPEGQGSAEKRKEA